MELGFQTRSRGTRMALSDDDSGIVVTRSETFTTLQRCIRDAEDNGYVHVDWSKSDTAQ